MNIPTPPSNPQTGRTPGLRLPAALDLVAQLAAILSPLLALLNRFAPTFAALHIPLHNRISRAHQRLARLLTRLANGTFRPHTPRPGQKGGPPALYLPHGRAWIVRKLGYHAAAYGSQLQFLLNAPETQALLAEAPPEALKSIGRTLRPIARLLGTDLPTALQLPPRPPKIRPPRPAKPAPPVHPPSPHDLWRRTHRRGLPPPLIAIPLRRKTRI